MADDADQLLVELCPAMQLVARRFRFGAGGALPLEQRGVLGFLDLLPGDLGLERSVRLLHFAGAFEDSGLHLPRIAGRRWRAMRRRLAQPLQLGHVDGVLEDVSDAALFIEDWRMGRTPEAILDPSVAILGPGHSIPDERDDVRLAGREDTLQRLPQQRRALVGGIGRVVRKRIEDIPPDELLQPSSR